MRHVLGGLELEVVFRLLGLVEPVISCGQVRLSVVHRAQLLVLEHDDPLVGLSLVEADASVGGLRLQPLTHPRLYTCSSVLGLEIEQKTGVLVVVRQLGLVGTVRRLHDLVLQLIEALLSVWTSIHDLICAVGVLVCSLEQVLIVLEVRLLHLVRSSHP